ncbi:MAG: hypothetical protein KDC98_01515 [Planctomycetes bacterium]|nr:hypothetical protein [Planctomycetota bacterium]
MRAPHALAFALAIAVASGLLLASWLWMGPASEAAPFGPVTAEKTASATRSNVADGVQATTTIEDDEPTWREAAPLAEAALAVDVLVVVAITGDPIGGATVRFAPSEPYGVSTEEQRELAALQELDLRAYLERIGGTAITDPTGHCTVMLPPGDVLLGASQGELFHARYVDSSAKGPIILALLPDRTLSILVLDADGLACKGAEIRAEAEWIGQGTSETRHGATDLAGRLEIRHAQCHVCDHLSDVRRIRASIGGCFSPMVEVDFSSPPAEIVLRLPPSGRVIVHVRDAQGRPLDLAYDAYRRVELTLLDQKPRSRREEYDLWNASRSARTAAALTPAGDAVFSHVALDKHLIAQHMQLWRSHVGPTRAAPEVEITLAESALDAILTATVLRPDGSVVAESEIRVSFASSRGGGGYGARTDVAGRMRFNLSNDMDGETWRIGIALEATPRLEVELPPRAICAGVNDLGEVRLQRRGILVAGRTQVDPSTPLDDVEIDVERYEDGEWSREWLTADWGPDEGQFEIHGSMPPGSRLRLIADEGAFLTANPTEFEPGARDVVVTVIEAGAVHATFLVADDMAHSRLSTCLRHLASGREATPIEEGRGRLNLSKDRDEHGGRMERRWRHLLPGQYELTVSCTGNPEPILCLGPIEVPSGRDGAPKLNDIDLRGRLRRIEIRAMTADGSPIASPGAYVLVRSNEVDWHAYSLTTGVAVLFASTSVEAFVIADGYCIAHEPAILESSTVRLLPATESRIDVEVPLSLPADVGLRLLLLPTLDLSADSRAYFDNGPSDALRRFFAESPAVDSHGRAIVRSRWSGTFRVVAVLSAGGHVNTVDLRPRPDEIVLPASEGVRLALDAGDLGAALARLHR